MDTKVLIVGAGPTGLVLACELARRGVAHRIIEKAPEAFTGSRGKGLQPRTLEILDDLGVIDRVLAEATDYPSIRRYAGTEVVWEGRITEHVEPTEDVPYANLALLPQGRTEALLRERLAELGGRVEFGVDLLDFEQDESGVVVTVAAQGGTERIAAGYLVGADGGRSAVRKRLGVGFEGETYETERFIVGDALADGLDHEFWHAWGHPTDQRRWLAMCPLPGGETFQLMLRLDADAETDLPTVQRLVDEMAPGVRLRELTWVSVYRPNIRMVDRFRVGRVFLAGDAAHVHSPAGGQGLNTGIQDAYNLGWKLATGSELLLDSYEAERLPVAADVLGISTRLHNSRQQQRGPETSQLGISYQGGPLATEPGAGNRAPDGHLPDGTRLFDLFRGPRWTLLARDEPPALGDHVRAHRVEHAYPGTFALIRPDGYVGLVTDDAPALVAYLDRLGLKESSALGAPPR